MTALMINDLPESKELDRQAMAEVRGGFFELFNHVIDVNSAGLRGRSDIPVLILQGTGDTVVTPDSQRAFKEKLCAEGGRVTYLEYSAIAHVDIRWTSFGDALYWMQRIMQGDVPVADCEPLGDGRQD